jgi:hypothetical protein
MGGSMGVQPAASKINGVMSMGFTARKAHVREDAPPRSAVREDVPRYSSYLAVTGGGAREDESWGEALRGSVRSALSLAKAMGISRGRVARQVGVAERTLETWIEHHGARTIPGDRLMRLIAQRDAMPLEARRLLARTLVAPAGLLVMEEEGTSLDYTPMPVQLCEITAAIGRLAEEARGVLDGASDGGGECTASEAPEMLKKVEAAMCELAQLRLGLRMKMGESEIGTRIDVKG